MSYNFKKINELELINEVPEGANVLIETDGATKRLPSTAIKSDDSYSKEESDTRYLTKDSIATPDLAQNDPEAPDYVKGRTHWVEEGVLFDGSITLIDYGEEYSFSDMQYEPINIKLFEGETYVVTFDGAVFECVATDGGEGIYIGDYGILTNSGTPTLPFAYAEGWFVARPGTHTVTIRGNIMNKIDKKFLPDNLCYVTTFYPGEDVNSVTWLFKDPNMQEKASKEELITAARNGVIILNCAGWQYIYGAAVVDVGLSEYGFARYWGPNGIYGDMVQYCAYTAEYEPPTAS